MKKRSCCLALSIMLAFMPASAETLISERFSADPSIHFFAGKYYLYATNDQDNSGTYWDSTDWRLFSSADLKSWQDEGSFLDISVFAWAEKTAKAWAPGAIERNGKFYFFAPVGGKQIGVAVSDKPFTGFKDPLGKALIETPRDANAGAEPIDPMVYIDKDGQTYLYFGTRIPKVVKLKENMQQLDGDIQDIIIQGFPEDDKKKKYGEAPYLHEHNGTYYFTFSTGWPGQIVYATGNNPMGPFTYRGVVFDYLPISTNHQAIIEKDGKSYFFYHDGSASGGSDHKRTIRFTELQYAKDGSILPIIIK